MSRVPLPFQLRAACLRDAAALNQIRIDAIRSEWPACYSASAIDAWCASLRVEYYEELWQTYGHDVIVATQRQRAIGFAHLDTVRARLVALYVLPRCARRGLGSALLRSIERSARASGVTELRLGSSLAAEGFYRRRGYLVGERAAVRLACGMSLSVSRMYKAFAPDVSSTTRSAPLSLLPDHLF